LGPVLAVIGCGLLFNAEFYRSMATEFAATHSLIYIYGLLSLSAGLAVLLVHPIWTKDWRVVITIVGWLIVVAGAVRVIAPRFASYLTTIVFDNDAVLMPVAATFLAVGLFLSAKGYRLNRRRLAKLVNEKLPAFQRPFPQPLRRFTS
jgi:hypothetical protein